MRWLATRVFAWVCAGVLVRTCVGVCLSVGVCGWEGAEGPGCVWRPVDLDDLAGVQAGVFVEDVPHRARRVVARRVVAHRAVLEAGV